MAHHRSARKRIRRNARRRAINRRRVHRMRSFVRRVEAAIAGGDRAAAEAALRAAQPELHRAASAGVAHRNTASRKISRLSARIRTMG